MRCVEAVSAVEELAMGAADWKEVVAIAPPADLPERLNGLSPLFSEGEMPARYTHPLVVYSTSFLLTS